MSSAHAAPGGLPQAAQIAAPTEPGGPSEQNPPAAAPARPRELGGRLGVLDPTRYGDWEHQGRCIDF